MKGERKFMDEISKKVTKFFDQRITRLLRTDP